MLDRVTTQQLTLPYWGLTGLIKVNYTAHRISAMEDFIGRGDRRLCPVMLKVWCRVSRRFLQGLLLESCIRLAVCSLFYVATALYLVLPPSLLHIHIFSWW